jgi:hypothetical protein
LGIGAIRHEEQAAKKEVDKLREQPTVLTRDNQGCFKVVKTFFIVNVGVRV